MYYTYFIPESKELTFEASTDSEALETALSALTTVFRDASYGKLAQGLANGEPLYCTIDRYGESKPEEGDDGCFPDPQSSASVNLSYRDVVLEDGTHEIKMSSVRILDFDGESKRVCAHCGRIISQGYVWDGTDTFCSEECAAQVFSGDTGCVGILVDEGRLEWEESFN